MSPCKFVSVTAVHRHAVVDIHVLVVNPLLKQQQQEQQQQHSVAILVQVATSALVVLTACFGDLWVCVLVSSNVGPLVSCSSWLLRD